MLLSLYVFVIVSMKQGAGKCGVCYMKIRLAKYIWVNLYFCLCITIVYYIFIIDLLLDSVFSMVGVDLIWNIAFLSFGMLPLLVIVVPRWRAFTTISILPGRVQSHLFRKLKCEVDTSKEVYYAIFEANIEKLAGGAAKYIAISNIPFPYQSSIDCYDLSKQIILPYKEGIKLYSPEKWIKQRQAAPMPPSDEGGGAERRRERQ